MKKVLLGGASALAFLALGSAAQAQSLSDTIGAGLIDLQGEFATGNYINESINIAAIDGSVNLIGTGLTAATNIDLGTLNVDADLLIEAAVGAGLDLEVILELIEGGDISGLLALAVAAGIDLDLGLGLDLGSIVADTQVGGTISSAAEIATLAVGAVNTGDIATGVSTVTAATSSDTFTAVTGAIEFSSDEVSSAANTSTTAASAAASQVSFSAGPATVAAISTAADFSSSGPLAGVYATNRAFNIADINGSVTAAANQIDLTGVSTLAVGAVNTGSIALGLEGGLADLADLN
ncbi:hypothetical protein [Aureimonas mangrovi]|uniref:hypothetical protein n=1 Tax=Aureimonas mangrovi TaxID=2758041 RepID=UPI00163D9812|nr:hypothetical protein [Aureimonas mangrovi]